ncbi:MAG: LCP family protein [Candidatus Saccharimonadales bacterium]
MDNKEQKFISDFVNNRPRQRGYKLNARQPNPIFMNKSNPKNFNKSSAKDDSFNTIKQPQSFNQSKSMLNTTLPNPAYGNFRTGSRPAEKKQPRWFRRHKVLTTILIVVVLLLGVGGWFGSRILGDINKVFHGNIFSDFGALFSTTRLNGEAQGRVNILLAGYQGANSDEGALTDSIMVVSIDTKNNTAFMLSIPRDLLVHFPGDGYQKINVANTYSNFSQPGYFNGGMGKLQQIIEQDLGIPIDYYALINYTAFEDAVNAVGGITVDIQSPDPRGLYDPNVDKAHGGPVKLPNGPVTLNGLQALALALARGDSPYAYGFPQSDINREQHQRQELSALEQKALSAGVLSNPLTLTHLFDAFGNNVSTNLSLADGLRLAQLLRAVNVSKIQSYGLSYGNSSSDLLTTYYSSTAGDSLIPKAGIDNYSQITNYYHSITLN